MGTDGVCGDVIMLGIWMLCENGRSLSGPYDHGRRMDALWERTEFVWTSSWLTHGCSAVAEGAYYPPPPSKSEFVGRARVFLA